MMNQPNIQSARNALASEGVLIASFPAVGYWLAFRYETGVLAAYGFPPHFAAVSLESTLVALLVLGGAVWLLFPIANIIAMLWPTEPTLQAKAGRIVIVLALPVWRAVFYGPRREDWGYYALAVSVVLVAELLWPLLVHRGTFRERMLSDEAAEALPRQRSISGRVLEVAGPFGYAVIVVIVLGGWLANVAGRADAETATSYLMVGDTPDLAVVRVYSERMLCVVVNTKDHTFTDMVVLPTNQGVTLTRHDIGPLKSGVIQSSISKRAPNPAMEPSAPPRS